MKILFKTMYGEETTLDLELSDSIESIKQKLEKEFNMIHGDTQILSYQGKILRNCLNLSEYEIDESKWIGVMYKKE
jgi:hypothetical protein